MVQSLGREHQSALPSDLCLLPPPLVQACALTAVYAVVGPGRPSPPDPTLVLFTRLPGHLSASLFQLLSFMSFKLH